MRVWKWIGIFFLGMVAAGFFVTCIATRDVRVKRDRLDAERRIAQTEYGPIEYISWGNGPPALVVHGAGGGFDQGRLIAQAYVGDGFRWIAPSRFGYLGSPMPADASTAAQAEAFADLLDYLGVKRAAVLAFSGGVPLALQFAQRYPDRTAGLALLSSAPFTPYIPAGPSRPIPDWLYQALFASDVFYWSLVKVSPRSLQEAFDVRPELRAKLTEAEQHFTTELVESFLPASQRAAGVDNEKAAIDPLASHELEGIEAPTLVVHARDDRINDFGIGLALSQRMLNVRSLWFDKGGHLLLGHHADLRKTISSFLRRSLGGSTVIPRP